MAITKPNKVGNTRIDLAYLIQQVIPDISIFGENLDSQIPFYASVYQDCCSWSGDGIYQENRKLKIHVYSWDTMTLCVKRGIKVSKISEFEYEIHAKETIENQIKDIENQLEEINQILKL